MSAQIIDLAAEREKRDARRRSADLGMLSALGVAFFFGWWCWSRLRRG